MERTAFHLILPQVCWIFLGLLTTLFQMIKQSYRIIFELETLWTEAIRHNLSLFRD